MTNRSTRLLFVTAKGTLGDLNADTEFTAIKNVLEGQHCQLEELRLATRASFAEILQNFEPDIIHFTVHADDLNEDFQAQSIGLRTSDDDPSIDWVHHEDLAALLSSDYLNTRLIVFNACASEQIANELSQVVGCAIGTNDLISNNTAVDFAKKFYRYLTNEPVQRSFEKTHSDMKFRHTDGFEIPVLKTHPETCASEIQFFQTPQSGITDLDNATDEEIFQHCLQVFQTQFSKNLPDNSVAASILSRRRKGTAYNRYVEPDLVKVENEERSPFAVEELLKPNGKFLVVGLSGIGKSSLIHNLGFRALEKGLLPVVVDLRDYEIPEAERAWGYTANKIFKLFKQNNFKISKSKIRNLLELWARNCKLLIAVDSIDESRPDSFIEFLNRRLEKHPVTENQRLSPTIISCRFQRFRKNLVINGFTELHLQVNKSRLRESLKEYRRFSTEDEQNTIVNHQLSETLLGFHLLVWGLIEGLEVPPLDDEKLTNELERSIHLEEVARFLVLPENEEKGLSKCPEPIEAIPFERLMYFAQIIALYYLDSVDTEKKLTAQGAAKLLEPSLTKNNINIEPESIVNYFQERRLIIFGIDGKIWFLHDFLAQSLANLLHVVPETQSDIPAPPYDVESITTRMAYLHGKKIKRIRALFYSYTNRGAIKSIFEQFETTAKGVFDRPPSNLTTNSLGVAGFCQQLVSAINHFRHNYQNASNREEFLSAINEALQELLSLIRELPSDENTAKHQLQTPREILFVEYVIGLGFFEVLGVIGELFLESIDEPVRRQYTHQMTFADGLSHVFDIQETVIEKINAQGEFEAESTEHVWQQLLKFYETIHLDIQAELDEAIGLRYIPQRKEIMSLAQIIHWDGWGGNGETSAKVFNTQTDPLSKTLTENGIHSFDWHGIGFSGNPSQKKRKVNFSNRHRMFGVAANQLKRVAANSGAALLTSSKLGNGELRTYKIWGDAVGPTFKAEHDLATAIAERLPAKGKRIKFQFNLTEMSGPSLNTLFDSVNLAKENDKFDLDAEIYFRDLNREFDDEPSQFSKFGRSTFERNFDSYSCAIALHQVADQKLGHARIREILGFATRILRAGGVISTPDVGVGVNLQVFLIPINLVDREGGWGLDVYSPTFAREPICRFQDLAVYESSRETYKVPIPIVSLATGTPFCAAKKGFAMYESIPYLIIELKHAEIDSLQSKWQSAGTIEELKSIENEFICKWRPEAEGWLDEVKSKINQTEQQKEHWSKIYQSRWSDPLISN